MPAPRWLARLNRHATNRVLGRITPYLPGFGVVIHRGRKSGDRYKTPVNVFRSSGGYVIALTYGSESDWVRNVLADGGCRLTSRGRTRTLTQPRLYRDKNRRDVPALVRVALRLIRVDEFLELKPGEPETGPSEKDS